MPLKILEAWERPPVEQLVVMLYGLPATGKTTSAFSSRNPLLLDFDKGADRAANIGRSVVIESWQDVSGITEKDLEGIDTVVVDTVGTALDLLTLDVIRKNPKHGRDGNLQIQGWGVLKTRFVNWLNHLKSMGKDVVLLAHTMEVKRGDGEAENQRIVAAGGSKDYVMRASDAIGHLSVSNSRRQLNFEHTETAIGKNPGRLPTLQVPPEDAIDGFLDDVLRQIKERMNTERLKQRERSKERLEQRAKSFDASLQEASIEQLREIRRQVGHDRSVGDEERKRRALAVKDYADKQGWVWDPESNVYVAGSAESASVNEETEAEREERIAKEGRDMDSMPV